MSNDFLNLLKSLPGNNKPLSSIEVKKEVDNKKQQHQKEEQSYSNNNNNEVYFDMNKQIFEFEQLKIDMNKELSKSKHIDNILSTIKSDMIILDDKISSILKSDIMLQNKDSKKSFDTSHLTLQSSLQKIEQRIFEGIESIIYYNIEKDKNLREFFNNYSTKYIEFVDLMYKKGVKTLLINDNKEITMIDKNQLQYIIQQMEIKNDRDQNSNEKSFIFVETSKTEITITCENKSLNIQ